MPTTSAGILPYRGACDHVEVLLVHPGGPFWTHKDAHAWSVAKGEAGPDEDLLAAAEREFAEELGFPAPEGRRLDLGEVRQSGGKVVRAWAMCAPTICRWARRPATASRWSGRPTRARSSPFPRSTGPNG